MTRNRFYGGPLTGAELDVRDDVFRVRVPIAHPLTAAAPSDDPTAESVPIVEYERLVIYGIPRAVFLLVEPVRQRLGQSEA